MEQAAQRENIVPVPVKPLSGWEVQKNVVWALLVRETKTMFGRYKLGLVWALVEALLMVVMLSLIFGFIMQRTVPDIPYPMFLLSGFLPYMFLRKMIARNSSALAANEGLLVYRQVYPLDLVVARSLLEVLVFFLALIVALAAFGWFGMTPEFHQPLEIVFYLVSLIMLSVGLSVFAALVSRAFPSMEKVLPLLMRPMLFLSCVLYPLQIVPYAYQKYFLWNPLVVINEGIRSGLFPNYRTPELPLFYPFILGIVFLWLGLAYYYRQYKSLYMPTRH